MNEHQEAKLFTHLEAFGQQLMKLFPDTLMVHLIVMRGNGDVDTCGLGRNPVLSRGLFKLGEIISAVLDDPTTQSAVAEEVARAREEEREKREQGSDVDDSNEPDLL